MIDDLKKANRSKEGALFVYANALFMLAASLRTACSVSDPKKSIIIAADATGLKVSNIGEWMRKKWKVRRGFVKLHMLACTETRRILATVVTDDRIGDSPMLKNMMETSKDTGRRSRHRRDKHRRAAGRSISGEPDPDKPVAVIGRRVDPTPGSMIPVDLPPPNMLAKGVSPEGTAR